MTIHMYLSLICVDNLPGRIRFVRTLPKGEFSARERLRWTIEGGELACYKHKGNTLFADPAPIAIGDREEQNGCGVLS